MTIQDDRTPEQRKTHHVIVAMTDSFMSGWGRCRNGTSYAGWACQPQHLTQVEHWVRSRSDAKRVRVVSGSWRPKGGEHDHAHIYVVEAEHPALRRD